MDRALSGVHATTEAIIDAIEAATGDLETEHGGDVADVMMSASLPFPLSSLCDATAYFISSLWPGDDLSQERAVNDVRKRVIEAVAAMRKETAG